MDHKLVDIRQPTPAIEIRANLDGIVERLQQQVTAIGIESDVRLALANNIQKGADRFNLSLETESDGDKLGIKLHFTKKDSDFEFPGYDATLLHHMPIADGQINGVDTRELDHRMKKADWYYGIAESEEKVISGFKETEAIEGDLRKLLEDKDGAIVAAQLWNNHVPVNTVGKPDFIAQVEAAHDLYPTRSVPADVKIDEARDMLKTDSHEQQLTGERTSIRPEFAFYESQPGEIKQHLQQLEAEGNNYVAYIEGAPITKEHLHGCKDTFEAIEFTYENTTDLDRCSFSSIRHMNEAVDQWSRLSEKDINLVSIEQKMAGADWQYVKVSPSHAHWEKAESNMEEIRKDLVLLCKVPGGLEIANALWDKYSPPSTVVKPAFLSANPGHSPNLAQGQDAVTSGHQVNDNKQVATASQNKQIISKVETPAKEAKHKHRRRLQ